MNPLAILGSLNRDERNAFLGSFLGWTLDAFDFFLTVFLFARIAADFGVPIPVIVGANTATLAFRPVGALIFGLLADRFGRRGPLMVNIAFYSLMELLTAFSPNFTVFIIIRALYGIGMGGEWGVGAALALESLPVKARGLASGVLQQGYATGFLVAAIVFGVFAHFAPPGSWRPLYVVGVVPALLVFYIRSFVKESPTFVAGKVKDVGRRGDLLRAFRVNPWIFIYAVLLMTAFNCMSHGTQDLYPLFLEKQHGLSPEVRSTVTVIVQIGAIVGGTLFGFLSQGIGRRRGIIIACAFGLLAIPLWAYAPNTALLTLGGFIMQFFVQGAWGIIPVHLNELSPGNVRGTFPGFTYQLGNLLSANIAMFETSLANKFAVTAGVANYARALSTTIAVVFIFVIVMTLIGRERRAIEFTNDVAA
jgi:SHS family lactate transporter-like MFS transporter